LAVPMGNSNSNNLIIVYDVDTGTYMFINGLIVDDFIEFEGDLYFCNSAGIFKMFQADTSNVLPYNSNWTTGKLNFGYLNAIKSTQMVYFLASGKGTIEISIENEKGKIKTKQITLTADEKFYRKRIKNKGRALKFSIASVDCSKFKLKNLQLTYEIDMD
jgi:hypothetical protein